MILNKTEFFEVRVFPSRLLCWTVGLALLLIPVALEARQQDSKAKPFTLEECIALAVHNNPQLISYRYDLQESEERIREARSVFYPTLQLSAAADRSSGSSGQGYADSSQTSSYTTGISSSYYLFQGGKKTASVDATRFGYEAATFQYETDLQDLTLRVTQSYYRLLQAEHLLKAIERSVERAELHLEFARARFEAGLASRSDILRAEVDLSNANLSLIRARNSRLFLAGTLNVFLGQEANQPIQIVDNLGDFLPEKLAGFDSLLSLAYELRPELRRMDSQLEIQKSNISLARSFRSPWFSAAANYNFAGTSLSSLSSRWSFGLTMSFPLFTGFATSSRIAQEEIALEALKRQRQALQQQISLDVWNAFLSLKEAEERIENTKKYLENAQENLNIAEGEYREGVGAMIEVVDAQTALVAAEGSHIEALADFKIAVVALEKALGRRFF